MRLKDLVSNLVFIGLALVGGQQTVAAKRISGSMIDNLVPIEGGYEIYIQGESRPLVIENAADFSEETLQKLKAHFEGERPISLTVDGRRVLGIGDSPVNEKAERLVPVRIPIKDVEIQRLKTLNKRRSYWLSEDGDFSRAETFIELTKAVSDHGLNPSDYAFADLLEKLKTGQIDRNDFDLEFNREVIRLAQDLRSGRLNPESVATDVKYRWKGFRDWAVLHQVLQDLPSNIWDQLAPKNSFYLETKTILNRLQGLQESGFKIGPIKPVPVDLVEGVRHPVVSALKETLMAYGYEIESNSDRFTPDLTAAVKVLQIANLTRPTGEIRPNDKATWEFFAYSLGSRIRQTALTLEKTRWLPDALPEKFILVNLARQRLQLQDVGFNDAESDLTHILNQKTIVGRVDRKTPSMSDRITQVILNPTWTVPAGIFEKDKIPLLAKIYQNRGGAEAVAKYLGPNGYRLLSRDLRTEISPLDVDWTQVTAENADFVIRQDSRFDNVLGRVKFQMTNSFSIYMHDTNEKHFFALPNRLKSSGCIRVEHPVDLARYALKGVPGWDETRIETTLSQRDREGIETRISLPKPIPVYTLPLTVERQGNAILFTRDLYRQNEALFRQLKAAGYEI